MRRFFNFAPAAMAALAVFSLSLYQSNGQAQEPDLENHLQSVIEPIRVADSSGDPVRHRSRSGVTGQQEGSVKGAPLVLEQGQAPPFPIAPSRSQSQQNQQPPLPIDESDARQQTTQDTTFPANGTAAPSQSIAPQASYRPATPIKPVSFQKAAPSISTHIEVPSYINLNQPAKMRIKLLNSGDVAAASVKLIATIPDHAKFVSSNPSPTHQRGQVYEFTVSDIGAKQTREVVIDLIPTQKKAIDIGTEIVIENVQRFTVGVREPKIKLALQGPTEANLGQNLTHKVLLENTGDGMAETIELQASFPNQLRCTKRHQIVIPTLEPGQKIEIEMPSLATLAGKAELSVSVAATGVESQTVKSGVQVFQPELEIAATGPQINFLNREGIYSIQLNNTGDMDASQVVVDLQVPAGMKVTTISQQATIHPSNGNLSWVFDKIASKSSQTIKFMTVATQQGQQDCVFTIRSQQTKDKTIYLTTNVVTRPELSVKLQNQSGPVQVGGKVQFLVVVENSGSSAAADLRVNVELPAALSADKQDDVDLLSIGNHISFEASKLEPGQKREFKFVAVANEKGEHVVRTILTTSASERQLSSEGVVYVYELNENRVSESLAPAVVR